MAPYNYNNFYDPVGSQANQQQPQGYSYANPNNPPSSNAQYPSQPASSYQTAYGSNSYNTQYGNTTYGSSAQQQPTSQAQSQSQSTSNSARAASALSALTPQDYQPATSNRAANATSQYDNSTWSGSGSQSYNTNNTAYSQTSRSQANPSPLYPTSSASTFGRLSLPEQSQTQSASPFGTSQTLPAATPNASSTQSYQNAPSSAASQHRQYMTAYTQQQNTQPPDRYASPLHAVQAQQRQQTHNRQTSRNSNPQPSPQIAGRNLQQQHQQQQQNQRQHSASVEPSPTTVDPSQVYDFRAEQERKARIDAERRKKIEAEKAARKAEEDARQKIEDDRKAAEDARVAEAERVEAERKKAEEDAKKAEEEASKQQQARERKNEQRRKAREEKRQSKTAATALQQMASGAGSSAGGGAGSDGGQSAASMAMMAAMMADQTGPPANDEEAEMRAMFAKMREFNSKNPALLAKMWEEERTAHAQSPTQPTTQAAAPPPPPPAKPASAAKRASGSKTQARQQTKTASANANAPVVVNANAPPTQPYPPFTGVNNPASNAPQSEKAPAPTTTPAQTGGGNTALWPPHKKGSLAEAAAKWLAGRPENLNTGFTISREQVLKILDSNPSYVQLCEMIEKTGVKFERSALAKELLKAVPDGLRNPTSGKPGAPSPANGMTAQMNAAAGPRKRGPNKAKNTYSVPNQGGRPTSNGTVSYQSPSFTSLADAARAVNGISTAPTFPNNSLASALGAGSAGQNHMDGPYFDQPINIDDDYQPINDSTPAPVDVKPEEPPRPPADKEEAARKRTFGDLVDLTGGDDSDDEGPPRKVFQRPGPVPIPNILLGQSANPMQRTQAAQQMVQQQYGPQSFGNQFMRPQAPYRPTQSPLPSNGAMLPSNGQIAAPPQPIKPKGPTEEQKQHERMRGKMLVEPIMRDRVARKNHYDSRTIARDVLLATGRHPDMRALNAHLNTMQKLLGDHGGVVDGAGNKSDLSTIKWSFIDPGEPADEAKAKDAAARTRAEDSDATEDADDESEQPPARDPPARINTLSSSAPTNHRDKSSAAQMRGSAPNENFIEPVVKRKRGRPPGRPSLAKKNLSAGASSPKATGASTSVTSPTNDNDTPTSPKYRKRRRTDSTSISTPARASPLNKDSSPTNMSSGGAVGYAAFRQYDADGNVIKKKGRPVGWKKSLHSREAQGLTPVKAGAKITGSKLRQSTTAASASAVDASPQRREYAVYKCLWRGCKGELDSLERLRKHVLKIHGVANADGDFECFWEEGCKNEGKHVDGRGKVREGEEGKATFEDIEGWLGHFDKVHLESVGWKLGDGMRGEGEFGV